MNYKSVIRLSPLGGEEKAYGHHRETDENVAEVADRHHEWDLVARNVEDHDVEQAENKQCHHGRREPARAVQLDGLA